MRRRLAHGALLAGALLLLGSLYLPWRSGSPETVLGLLHPPPLSYDGWSSGIGDAAALAALALAFAAGAALVLPVLADRLPLATCALVAGYFGFAVLAQLNSTAGRGFAVELHWARGAYVGVTGAVVVLAVAVALLGLPRRTELAAVVLAVALLVAFLLPWFSADVEGMEFQTLGIALTPVAVAAALAARTVTRGRGEGMVAAGVVLFAVAGLSWTSEVGGRTYGAWLALVAALGLAGLAWVTGARPRRPAAAPALAAASLVLVASFFFQWERICTPAAPCLAVNAWPSEAATAAAVVALAMLVVPAAELGASVGLLVATVGFVVTSNGDVGLAYGAFVGFAAAAVLVALSVRPVRLPRISSARLVPVAACVAFVALVVVPWWEVLPHGLQSALRFAPLSWLTIAGVLLAIHLLVLWMRPAGALLVAVPIGMLALTIVDLLRFRPNLDWGAALAPVLCAALAALGGLELRGGLRVPELLRVDRIGA